MANTKPMKTLLLGLLLLAPFAGVQAAAKAATVKVRMDDVLQVRPVSLIGGNTEDLNFQLYGGLYSQLLHGEAFEEEIGVDFLGLTDRETLRVWVRRDGRNQPFLWLFSGRGYEGIDDVDKVAGIIQQEPGNKKKKGPVAKPVTVGPLTFKGSYLSVNQLPENIGKQLLERFTGSEQISRQWKKVQSKTADGSFTLVRKGQLTGDQAQQISFVKGSGEWGIDNAGLHRGGIKFEMDKPYEGILRVKSDRKQSLYLSLRNEHGKVLAEQNAQLKADPGNYQRVEFTLVPDAGTASGRFALVLREPGTVTVDYAFLQSGPWGRFHGLPVRLDMANALKSMTVRAIRYNGSMVNRSPDGHLYKWKEMIGPRDARVPYHGWFNPYASHGFTFFEFMDFCEILNIDCMFGIRIDETEQDVRDLVDYCLGSKDTEWGRKRIELGHPKPYRLQMVQIGNEEKGDSEYAERVKVLAGAIWDKNPEIEIALSLNVRGWEAGDERAVHLLDIARFVHRRGQGHKLVLDAHYHSTVDHADTGLANFVGLDMHDYLAEEIPGFELRLWPMEENGSRCDWDRGLAHAHNLNTFNRLPLCVERTGTANIFQAWGKNLVWDQGRIHFTPEKIFYQPSYYVDRMFGVEWLPVVLNAASSEPLLDATAKTNEKGDVLTLYVANIGTEAVDATFEISGFTPSKVEVMRIGSPDHEAHNTPENPTAIVPVKVAWDPATRKMQIPGDSFTTIRFAGSAFSGFDASKAKGSASQSGAAEVKFSVDTGKVTHRVDPKIYGHFLEHIYHSCNGGLWGELIWNRSFEGGETGGTWSRQDDYLAQEGGAADTRLVFGSPQWQDYEFTVEARKTGGNEGFLILLRALNKDEFYWANLGGWGNRGYALERGIIKGEKRWGGVTRRHDGQIEEDRWYRIRARCEGPRIQVWLDDVPVIDYTDDGKGAPRGQAGVGTWSTQAQFRNFKVTALDGKTLHEGIPPIPGGNPVAVPGWYTVGSARVSTSTESPLNGEKCKLIETGSKAGGLAQQPMKINEDETYRGSLWIRGEAPAGLSVQLMDGGTVLARQTLPAPSAQWKELPIDLKPTGSSDNAALQIMVPPADKVWLDQVSLMPDSWREPGGFRPDLLQAVADLKPPVIRWPGGCYASPYRWKDGIGPQYKRGPHPKSMWDDKEVNSFGTDEFVALCRRVGAEPLIVINIGTPQWNQDVLDNDFLQEALDWLEYCNGPADSKWGRVRAANGHPEPYNVKYWEIDNETWRMGAAAYAAAVNQFGSAMRAVDPAIRLAACGSGGYNQDWNRVIISQSGSNFDYISTHHYEKPDNYASGPKQDEAFFRELKTVIDAGPNPDIKIYCSEWNAQSTDWKTGLYCGGILNVFERCGDFFGMGGPALFLRHVSATKWDNAFVNFDRCGWFPAPNYVVMKLWHDHFAPNFLALEGELNGADIVATKSEDGRKVYLKAVNPTAVVKRVTVQLTGGFKPKSASMQRVAPGGLAARNSLTQPNAVHPESAAVVLNGGTVTFELPAYSAGVVTLTAK